jgi:hypothetical protein
MPENVYNVVGVVAYLHVFVFVMHLQVFLGLSSQVEVGGAEFQFLGFQGELSEFESMATLLTAAFRISRSTVITLLLSLGITWS